MRTCGNCGSTQGPFDRLFVGFRKTGTWVFTCPQPRNGSPEQKAEASKDCNVRRLKAMGLDPE